MHPHIHVPYRHTFVTQRCTKHRADTQKIRKGVVQLPTRLQGLAARKQQHKFRNYSQDRTHKCAQDAYDHHLEQTWHRKRIRDSSTSRLRTSGGKRGLLHAQSGCAGYDRVCDECLTSKGVAQTRLSSEKGDFKQSSRCRCESTSEKSVSVRGGV